MTRLTQFVALLLTLSASACGVQHAPRGVLGAYRLDDGRVISIRPSEGTSLRYREFRSGRTGRLHFIDNGRYQAGPGFSDRDPAAVTTEFQLDSLGQAERLVWRESGQGQRSGARIGRDVWIGFESDGARLSGRLHLPEGPGPFPGIVLVHGSGEDPGSDWLFNGDFLVANGFAILAYDKRGTGGSQGEFTFDFQQLARDAAAGVGFLRSRPEINGEKIGISGYSQGGWVAPLAASMTEVQFVLVNYGMMESPATEAKMEMMKLLEDGGVTGTDLQAGDSLVTAAVSLVAGGLREGWEQFERLKRRYRDASWLELLDGTPVDQLVSYPKWVAKLVGRRQLPKGLRWDYDSGPLLETLCTPLSWFLGEEDLSAPNKLTIPRLRRLEGEGHPVELTLFPGADHGMLLFQEEEGSRSYTGYDPGYFEAEVEAAQRWISRADWVVEYPGCSGGEGNP